MEEEEVSGAAEKQLKSWESFAVICASVPVKGCVHNRYDVKQRTNVAAEDPPTPPTNTSLSQMGNDSLAFAYLERGSACRSICMGPICQYLISAGN